MAILFDYFFVSFLQRADHPRADEFCGSQGTQNRHPPGSLWSVKPSNCAACQPPVPGLAMNRGNIPASQKKAPFLPESKKMLYPLAIQIFSATPTVVWTTHQEVDAFPSSSQGLPSSERLPQTPPMQKLSRVQQAFGPSRLGQDGKIITREIPDSRRPVTGVRRTLTRGDCTASLAAVGALSTCTLAQKVLSFGP